MIVWQFLFVIWDSDRYLNLYRILNKFKFFSFNSAHFENVPDFSGVSFKCVLMVHFLDLSL